MKITRWKPDTCDCVIEYEWDETVAQDQRTHTGKNIISTCSTHAGLNTAQTFQALLDENQGKNKALGHIKQNYSRITQTVTQSDGSTSVEFKPGEEVTHSFDTAKVGNSRVIKIHAASLTGQERQQLKGELEQLLGVSKVVVIPTN